VAKAVSEQYKISTVVSPEELLADPSIEIVLNLTPIAVHVGVTQAALQAGKHVYSEKSLATTVEDAQGILDAARSRGLVVACAPDTLLGSGFQTAWQALAGGRIGRALSASAAMFRSALAAPSFYTKGPTAFFDMSPYYLSALVSLLGPVTRVSGATRTWPSDEKPEDTATGASIAISGTLEFAGGATASLTLSWGTGHRHEVPILDVYGENGVIEFPNPNNFGDAAFIRDYTETDRGELPGSRQDASLPHNLRGLGVAEMVLALQEGRAPRASGELACHVVDLVASLVQSAEEGRRIELTTTCESPQPLAAGVRDQLLG
jgi:predicted dehydrogenase